MSESRSRWFATFAAGFGPLVARLLERDAEGSRALGLEDNAIRFEFDREPDSLLDYCRSLFRILGETRADGGPSRQPGGPVSRLAASAFAFARDRRALGGIRSSGGRDRFVLRAFGPEDPEPLPQAARAGLEAAIAASSGARPDRRGAPGCREFRLQARSDGSVLFLERRGSGVPRDEEGRRGELPRTTCRLLAELSGPRPGDVFLDPFCGYGGIALERALAAPYRFVFAQDIDPGKVSAVKDALGGRAFERRRKTIFPKVRDALEDGAFDPGFIDAIATDPPWGLYEGGPGSGEAGTLLEAFARKADLLLGAEGRLVLLISRDLVDRAREAAAGAFELREAYDVLVSGRKASALRFGRPEGSRSAEGRAPQAPAR